MKPVLVGLQLIFFIISFELGVNNVKIIKGAAEEGSPGIFILKPNKFFFPRRDIMWPFFIFLLLYQR